MEYAFLLSDYDSRVKTFTSLCEIANEACQAWFPPQENKWRTETPIKWYIDGKMVTDR